MNHKSHFCVQSDWSDPVQSKKNVIEDFEEGATTSKTLTFKEVRKYLNTRMLSAEHPNIASMSLNDMRRNFQKDDKKLEELHLHITREREMEIN